jgi:hypothetical protein
MPGLLCFWMPLITAAIGLSCLWRDRCSRYFVVLCRALEEEAARRKAAEAEEARTRQV